MSTVSSSSRVSTASAASSLGWRANEGPSCTAFHDSDEDNTAHTQSLTTSPQTLHGLIGAASDSSHGSVPSFSALTDYSPPSSTMAEHHQALRAIADITASPEFQSVGDNFAADFDAYADEPLFDDYDYEYSPEPELEHDDSPRASPHDTPYTPFLTTPRLAMEVDFGSAGAAYTVEENLNELAGQLLALPDDYSEANGVGSLRGWGDDGRRVERVQHRRAGAEDEELVQVGRRGQLVVDGTQENDLAGQLLAHPDEYSEAGLVNEKLFARPNLDKLLMFSPSSPMLHSFDAFPSTAPVIPPPPPSQAVRPTRTPRSLPHATGTRRGITVNDLIPDDAPTMKRTYLTPSATSRKAVPAQPTKEVLDEIENKRRSNTLAARKSRKRKLQKTQELEDTVDELDRLVTIWRQRALMGQSLLKQRGIMLDFGNKA
ncbi:BZIP domain-containing protein [Mycena indigotica]|uniref:BZIP domain-containing protein n=1 Tax=Mycena indigotica TaxID=2126181 RepID=A0A8H6VXX5_9AGAR|nr:BZIP domain-containing protein [Mycena indigotica]KAF7292239.1 BZIP domain-containing protein [Mycena indigotica]